MLVELARMPLPLKVACVRLAKRLLPSVTPDGGAPDGGAPDERCMMHWREGFLSAALWDLPGIHVVNHGH